MPSSAPRPAIHLRCRRSSPPRRRRQPKARSQRKAPRRAARQLPGAEILPALAKADAKKGEASVALCKVCHSFDKGAPSPIGPNLYGVVGRKIASLEGFNYSPALKGKASEGDWTFEHLDLWLTNPQAFAPGTIMAFPGLPDLHTRADVIDFLRTKSDNPVPLPEAAPAAAPAPAAEEKPARRCCSGSRREAGRGSCRSGSGRETCRSASGPGSQGETGRSPPAPATEEKPAEAPPAPAEEAPSETPAPAPDANFSEPSTDRQPQAVLPGEEAAPAEAAPAAESLLRLEISRSRRRQGNRSQPIPTANHNSSTLRPSPALQAGEDQHER